MGSRPDSVKRRRVVVVAADDDALVGGIATEVDIVGR
jgi:hypothetical protein